MGKERRAGLGLWDRLVLLVAWAVTCGLVYLLGIYVGKGMQERLLGHEERVVRLPVTTAPPPEVEPRKEEKELTFYDTLVRDAETERPRRAAEPAPKPPPSPPAVAPAPVGRSAPLPAATATPAVARPTPPAPTVNPATVRTPPARPAPATGGLPRPPSVPAREREAVAPPAPPPAAPRVGAGSWTVLANPTRSHAEADGLARQLRSRGYAASVVRVLRAGDTWYRVAVGRFASSEQATEMMHRLREQEGVAHVFVAAE
jgi:hypothetical protein